MNHWIDRVRQIFTKHQPLPPGMYHYQAPPEAPAPYRLHLRLEPDGQGVLIINARTVLHLNQTAAEFAYYMVAGLPETEAVSKIVARYRVSVDQAHQDYHELIERIDTLITTPDLAPDTFLDMDRQALYSASSAPYRLDCALTYRLGEDASPDAAPLDRVRRELTTDEWQAIFAKAWNAGVPHVIFTGGEPTLRPDLAELVTAAEELGMVAGLLTDGLRLSNPSYLHGLLQSGLDHLLLLLDPGSEESWEALRDALVEDLHVTVHLTLQPRHQGEIAGLLERLAGMHVQHISLSARDPSLKAALQQARQLAAHLGLNLVWDLPVPYSAANPVALELEPEEIVQGAGSAWLYVEPDGDVLAGQGIYPVMGNLLTDPWEQVWNNRVTAAA
jgi:organic radical activating enzyme